MLSSHTPSESETTAKFREATVADLRAKNTTRRAGRFRVWRDVGGINGRLAWPACRVGSRRSVVRIMKIVMLSRTNDKEKV